MAGANLTLQPHGLAGHPLPGFGTGLGVHCYQQATPTGF